tara:strand:+ start:26 stop:1465 length:1440 start_codon:yes stop_codon:yes gene_type:complete
MAYLIKNDSLSWQKGHLVLELVEDNFRFYTEEYPDTVTPVTYDCECDPINWSVEGQINSDNALILDLQASYSPETDLTLCHGGESYDMIINPYIMWQPSDPVCGANGTNLAGAPSWIDRASYASDGENIRTGASFPEWQIHLQWHGLGPHPVYCMEGDEVPNKYSLYHNGVKIGVSLINGDMPPTYDHGSVPEPLFPNMAFGGVCLPVGNFSADGTETYVVFDADDSSGQGFTACPLCYDSADMVALSQSDLYLCYYDGSKYINIILEYNSTFNQSPVWQEVYESLGSGWVLSWGKCSHNTMYGTSQTGNSVWVLENSGLGVVETQSSSDNDNPEGDYGSHELSYADPGACCYNAALPFADETSLQDTYYLCYDTNPDGVASYSQVELNKQSSSSGFVYQDDSGLWALSYGMCYNETGYGSLGDGSNQWVLEAFGVSDYLAFESAREDVLGVDGEYSDQGSFSGNLRKVTITLTSSACP